MKKKLEGELTAAAPAEAKAAPEDYLSWGLTLLNLACYGRTYGGLRKGRIYGVVGRSSGGKSFLAKTVHAEAVRNPAFKNYRLVYRDVERGANMDAEKFFGAELAGRTDGDAYCPETVQEFLEDVTIEIGRSKPCVYVIDSLDSLVGVGEQKMTDNKAKAYSQGLRRLIAPLDESGSILVMVGQAKADLRSPFGGDTRSGGRSPEFYSTLDVWLRRVKTLTRPYKKKNVPVGILVRAQVKKNRISGLDRTVLFPIYWSYGIDDIGANVDYLCSMHWARQKGIIQPVELGIDGGFTRDKLIERVEADSLQRELQLLVGKVWRGVEEAVTPKREPRYS